MQYLLLTKSVMKAYNMYVATVLHNLNSLQGCLAFEPTPF